MKLDPRKIRYCERPGCGAAYKKPQNYGYAQFAQRKWCSHECARVMARGVPKKKKEAAP